MSACDFDFRCLWVAFFWTWACALCSNRMEVGRLGAQRSRQEQSVQKYPISVVLLCNPDSVKIMFIHFQRTKSVLNAFPFFLVEDNCLLRTRGTGQWAPDWNSHKTCLSAALHTCEKDLWMQKLRCVFEHVALCQQRAFKADSGENRSKAIVRGKKTTGWTESLSRVSSRSWEVFVNPGDDLCSFSNTVW